MKPGIVLLAATSPEWAECVAANFDSFLLDHASAERKASAMAVSFVVQYPNRYELHEPMILLAREELRHYQQVMKWVHRRNLLWERDEKDPYVARLLKKLSHETEIRLLDRLLMGGVIEARGVERFGLVGNILSSEELARFYHRLSASEARHADLFLNLARHFFDDGLIEERLRQWLVWEAEAMASVPVRPALH